MHVVFENNLLEVQKSPLVWDLGDDDDDGDDDDEYGSDVDDKYGVKMEIMRTQKIKLNVLVYKILKAVPSVALAPRQSMSVTRLACDTLGRNSSSQRTIFGRKEIRPKQQRDGKWKDALSKYKRQRRQVKYYTFDKKKKLDVSIDRIHEW